MGNCAKASTTIEIRSKSFDQNDILFTFPHPGVHEHKILGMKRQSEEYFDIEMKFGFAGRPSI